MLRETHQISERKLDHQSHPSLSLGRLIYERLLLMSETRSHQKEHLETSVRTELRDETVCRWLRIFLDRGHGTRICNCSLTNLLLASESFYETKIWRRDGGDFEM